MSVVADAVVRILGSPASQQLRITPVAAKEYADSVGTPFRHGNHALNAYNKVVAVLTEVCKTTPSPVVLWVVWVCVVYTRNNEKG